MFVRSVGSRRDWRWLWLVFGFMAIIAAFALDQAVDGRLYLPHQEAPRRTASLVSKYGDWPPVLFSGLVVVAGLVFARRFAGGRLFLLILLAGLLTGLGATLIRSTTGRTRPLAAAPQGFYGPRYQGKWILGRSEFGSFPSGHTAVWAGLAGAAWFRRRAMALVFLAGALVVAWSRIALGDHHFSDVMASLVFGLSVAPWLCMRLEKPVAWGWAKMGLPI